MRRLARLLLRAALTVAALRAVTSMVVGFIGERAEPEADDFDLLAVMDGRRFVSRARQLRGGRIRVVAGGVDVDLRQAQLSPEGASLQVRIFAGGVRILVDPSWRVEVDADVRSGGQRIDVPDSDRLPDAAPVVRIHALVRAGRLEVTTECWD